MTQRRQQRRAARRPVRASPPTSAARPARDAAAAADRPLREDLVTQAVLEAYGAIRHEGRLSDRALEFTLRHKRHLYSSERRAVSERVYALLRRQRTVDHLLAEVDRGFSARGTSGQDLLRVAASRILMGESAAKVARQMALGEAEAKLFEALPKAAKALHQRPREERFPIAASLPDFLAARFLRELGDEAEAAAEAMNERGPLCVRVNTLKTSRDELLVRLGEEGVRATAAPLSPLGVVLETHQNAYALASFKEGLFEIQDEGSQLLGMLVDPPPTRVVDACAGAGGKTLQLSAEMKNRGELFAYDIDAARQDELRRRARRAGAHNIRVFQVPPDGPSAREAVRKLEGQVDRVLVDAPCTGTGTLRRKPDGRYRLRESDVAAFAQRQAALLETFCHLVKPGGRLIYGTCSILREENEEVVAAFLAAHPEFALRPVDELLPVSAAGKVSREGFLRLFPHRHGTDGFFGAVLVKAKGG